LFELYARLATMVIASDIVPRINCQASLSFSDG
jgi:hypothetical protein